MRRGINGQTEDHQLDAMHTFIQRSITLKRAIRGQWRWITTLRSTTILPNRITPTLRQHPPLSGTPPPTFPFLNPEVVPTRPNLEESSPAGNLFRLTWPTNPRNILVVKKRRDDRVKEAAVAFAKYFPLRRRGIAFSGLRAGLW